MKLATKRHKHIFNVVVYLKSMHHPPRGADNFHIACCRGFEITARSLNTAEHQACLAVDNRRTLKTGQSFESTKIDTQPIPLAQRANPPRGQRFSEAAAVTPTERAVNRSVARVARP